jgi:hypothetical protein
MVFLSVNLLTASSHAGRVFTAYLGSGGDKIDLLCTGNNSDLRL